MTTATAIKKYEVTLQFKSIPAEVKAEIAEKAIADFDRMQEFFKDTEFSSDRLAKREETIARKTAEQEWCWLYDNKSLHTIFADNKADAAKQARELAKQLGLRFVYVYYTPAKKEA